MGEDLDNSHAPERKTFRIKLPPRPETGALVQESPSIEQKDGAAIDRPSESSLAIEQTIEFIRGCGLTDRPNSPVRDQLRDKAKSQRAWGGVTLILLGLLALTVAGISR